MSIIGVAFAVALVIGVIAIVGNLSNRINGKNPEKLYDSLTSTISSSGNYVINVQKSGSGTLFIGDSGDSKAIDELFDEMNQARRHMCLVTDKSQNFVGIVTMEDILEQLVGEIYDEADDMPEEEAVQ